MGAMISTMLAPLVFALLAGPDSRDRDGAVTVTEANTDERGFLVHEVKSPYQAGATQIRVVLPDKLEEGKRYPVVFVLPVEAGLEHRYGDGLVEVKKHGLANKFHAIFVAPTFSHLPWYADHPTKPEIRQEAYFLKVVVPFIEKTYPVRTEASGRLLLGFSKSGWGAFSLLLRNPDLFGKAAAWDAPLMMDQPGPYGSKDVFGTRENFELYRITSLLKARADMFQKEKRLILLGYGNFRKHHEKAHALITDLKIAHQYRNGPARQHDWHSGWMAEAAELLLAAPLEGKSLCDMEIVRVQAQIKELLQQAEQMDAEEDAALGSRRGDELPDELKRRSVRLSKIEEAKARLETEAAARAAQEQRRRDADQAQRQAEGHKRRGKEPAPVDPTPEAKAQTNFTDPEAKIMKQSNKGFDYSFNAQSSGGRRDADHRSRASPLRPTISNRQYRWPRWLWKT